MLSVLLGVILALGLVVAIGGVIGSQLADLTRGLPQYAGMVERKVSTVRNYTVGQLSQLADRIGTHGGSSTSRPDVLSEDPTAAQPAAAARPQTQQPESPWSWRGAISLRCSRLYVGSFISALLPMALAAAVEPGWAMVLWTLGLYALVEGLTGQIIEPMVYGHSTGLSPFSVVVAAIFWSWLWALSASSYPPLLPCALSLWDDT